MQSDRWRPAELFDFRYVEQLLRRTVRPGGIELDLAFVADNMSYFRREVADGDVSPVPTLRKPRSE